MYDACFFGFQRSQIMREVTFAVNDDAQQAAFGSVTCAVFRTAADGTAVVPVIHQSDQCMADDHEDVIMEVRRLGKGSSAGICYVPV